MKLSARLKFILPALALLSMAGGHAQDAPAAGTVPAVPASMLDMKAMKAENRKLQKSVMRALSSSKGLNAANIAVIARRGEVTLRGSVKDSAQAEIATAVASSVNGVAKIRNELLIRPE